MAAEINQKKRAGDKDENSENPSKRSMADHDGKDLESEVNRILGGLKLEDIRKHGIKKLPEEKYKKATEKEEGITNLCGYASYYLAEQWDYDALENKELLRKFLYRFFIEVV